MVTRLLTPIVDAAAAVWRRRAELVEIAGGVCLVVAAAMVAPALAWLTAGAALVVKAADIDRKTRQ